MNKKQRDLKKLKAFAKALGLKTAFKVAKKTDPGACWSPDLSITFFIRKNDSQRKLLLNLLHELAHHADFIEQKKVHPEMLYDALNTEDSRKNKNSPKVDKSMRLLILEDETRAAGYRQSIRKQLDLESITEEDVDQDIKLDIWIYNYYYQKGEFPTLKQVSDARCNILAKSNTTRRTKRNG